MTLFCATRTGRRSKNPAKAGVFLFGPKLRHHHGDVIG